MISVKLKILNCAIIMYNNTDLIDILKMPGYNTQKNLLFGLYILYIVLTKLFKINNQGEFHKFYQIAT